MKHYEKSDIVEGTFDLESGYTARVRTQFDSDMGPPWEEHAGHGVVSDWTTRDKRSGERVLHESGYQRRYYDFRVTQIRG